MSSSPDEDSFDLCDDMDEFNEEDCGLSIARNHENMGQQDNIDDRRTSLQFTPGAGNTSAEFITIQNDVLQQLKHEKEDLSQKLLKLENTVKQKEQKLTSKERKYVRLEEKCIRDKKSFEECQKQLASQHETEKDRMLKEIQRLSCFWDQGRAQKERIHELEKQQKQSNSIQTELKGKLQQAEGMILSLRKDNNSLEEEKKRLLHRDKESFEESQKPVASQHETEKEGLLNEIQRLSTFGDQCRAQQKRIHELEKQQEQSNNIQTELKAKVQQAEGMIIALRKNNNSLEEEKKRLLHRLSQLAGAKLTLDNPNIADLSDTKRPTKLAEEFAELYDNEWTDAFEDVEIENEQAKTAFMLKVLQRASEICSEVSNAHMDGIRKGLCTLPVRTNDSSGSSSKMQPEQKISLTMDNKEKENDEMTKAKRSRRNSQQEHAESHVPSMML
ncbi:capping protein inhibiting regulator of actin dynamics-like isoform X3 [Mercenaria mercenaria]|uniref:capping protein inhibiting regulator of actin dynamics-like isoform X3 n=1 Tax=Mercenaria mercenaria TaxID=6596 RepID=UPI00234E3F21|nr:capping protein inhibiting regulator of actin dynamics-like isoform X3 [Mercenaria mercenaria]